MESSARFLYDLHYPPELVPAKRSRLGDLHQVAHMAFVPLIVGLHLVAAPNHPFIERVAADVLKGHDNRLVHAITNDAPFSHFPLTTILHPSFSPCQ